MVTERPWEGLVGPLNSQSRNVRLDMGFILALRLCSLYFYS